MGNEFVDELDNAQRQWRENRRKTFAACAFRGYTDGQVEESYATGIATITNYEVALTPAELVSWRKRERKVSDELV